MQVAAGLSYNRCDLFAIFCKHRFSVSLQLSFTY